MCLSVFICCFSYAFSHVCKLLDMIGQHNTPNNIWSLNPVYFLFRYLWKVRSESNKERIKINNRKSPIFKLLLSVNEVFDRDIWRCRIQRLFLYQVKQTRNLFNSITRWLLMSVTFREKNNFRNHSSFKQIFAFF